MQTFLPYENFVETAKCLDYRRLGKQRVEAYQLLLGMYDPDKFGWKNHPAFKMWNGYDLFLAGYGLTMCQEWMFRGYKDTLSAKFMDIFKNPPYKNTHKPKWLGNLEFHASHRKALLFKDFLWYNKFGWNETPELNYIWPV